MNASRIHLPVQELWDQILEFASERTKDIRSLALVSRSMCPLAQSRIFYHIEFRRPSHDHHVSRSYDEVAACHRLGETLIDSPHLIPYIRSLTVRIDLGLHTEIMGMRLSNLRCVRLSGYINFTELTEPAVWTEELGHFLGMPSIRRLEIAVAGTFPPRIFQYLMPHITALSFGPGTLYRLPEIPEIQLQGRRSSITKLSLRYCPRAITDWFDDPLCPFDFTELIEVDTGSSLTEGLKTILESARATIRKLAFSLLDIPLLDLSRFPRLTHIAMDAHVPSALTVFSTSISSLGRSSLIQEISIRIALFNDDSWTDLETTIHGFDALLPSGIFPALQRVNIVLWMLKDSQVSGSFDYGILFRASAPALSGRRLLSVTVTEI